MDTGKVRPAKFVQIAIAKAEYSTRLIALDAAGGVWEYMWTSGNTGYWLALSERRGPPPPPPRPEPAPPTIEELARREVEAIAPGDA